MIALFLLLSLFNGALLSFQQVLNAALAVRLGSMGGSVFNHLTGTLLAGILLFIGVGTGELKTAGIPTVYFLGGCLGVCSVAMGNYAIPRIGAAKMAILFTCSQLFASSLIDHFGWLGTRVVPLTFSRLAGIFLLITGAALILTKEKSKASGSLIRA